jgi:hypothetical protein
MLMKRSTIARAKTKVPTDIEIWGIHIGVASWPWEHRSAGVTST